MAQCLHLEPSCWVEDNAFCPGRPSKLQNQQTKEEERLKCLYWCLIMIPVHVIYNYIQVEVVLFYWVYRYWLVIGYVLILLTLSLNWNTKPWETAFTPNFTCEPRQSRACYVIPPVSFSKPVQGPLQWSWTNFVWHDPCWYVVRVRHYNRPQTYAILAMDHYRALGGGERIKQWSRWAFRNELFPCTADRKWLKHMWKSRNKVNWSVFPIRF